MKKILLATTILSMSAGFAAADVAVSGDARMGVVSTDGTAVFSNRARIKFSGSGTTDGGLAFGASFRAHEAAAAESTGNSGSVFISGAFGKITMGSVDSGDAASVGQLASVGFTGLSSGNSINYSADAGGDGGLPGTLTDAGGAKVLYTYSAGALTVNASSAQLTDGGATSYGIGGSYAAGALTVGLGYGVVDGGTVGVTHEAATDFTENADASVTDMSLSASYVTGATTIKGIYQQKTIEATDAASVVVGAVHDAVNLSATATSMGLSVVQKMDALTLTAYGINTTVDADADMSADNPTVSRYGIGFGYDLGGGASVAGGWATVDALVPTVIADAVVGNYGNAALYTLTSVSHDQFDLGLNFSF